MIVNGTDIYMTRGDTESLTVSLRNLAGINVPLVTGDTVYFTVKKNINTVEKTLQFVVQNFTDGKAIINIQPSDTADLRYGYYVYDIQVTLANGTKKTIVPPSVFQIGGEVTYE